jgi:hypothetical protein
MAVMVRFLMNPMLASGGFLDCYTRAVERDAYMDVLVLRQSDIAHSLLHLCGHNLVATKGMK